MLLYNKRLVFSISLPRVRALRDHLPSAEETNLSKVCFCSTISLYLSMYGGIADCLGKTVYSQFPAVLFSISIAQVLSLSL